MHRLKSDFWKLMFVSYCIVFEFYSGKKTAYLSQSTDINQHAMPEKDTKG